MRMLRMLTVPLVVTAAAGCSDTTGPDMTSVAGTYIATEFTITSGAVSVDLLEEGASIALTLLPDGTTSGRVVVPPTPGIDPIDEDLAGTWSLSGRTVTFSHAADTFLRDMGFRYTADGRLVGDAVYPEGVLVVELTSGPLPLAL